METIIFYGAAFLIWVLWELVFGEGSGDTTAARRSKEKGRSKRADIHSSQQKLSTSKTLGAFSELTDQKELIGQPFELKCRREAFTEQEFTILSHYGTWLSALSSEEIAPLNHDQTAFVSDCQHCAGLELNEMTSFITSRASDDVIKKIWFKYLFRIKYEEENA